MRHGNQGSSSGRLALLLAGCSGFNPSSTTPATIHGVSFHGSLFGGRQPVSGAATTFYAAVTTYAAAGTLTAPNALAFDTLGDVWVTTSNALVELSAGGTSLGSTTTNVATPTAVAINPK